MGTKLGPILKTKEISLSELNGKKLVVDSFNILYQFLTTIRQQDGSFLTDSKGNITSHLSGLFFRTTKLMKQGIKLAFVFDGVPPKLKQKERDRRSTLKEDAQRKYEKAVEEGDIELMRKYAGRTTRLTADQIEEAKDLIDALGLPVIQAPSEGEAQAALMVKKGDFYGLLSQDTDGLLFGTPRLIKNLSITGRRKKPGSSVYYSINPEVIELDSNLRENMITQDQLIVISILCGTDFNIGGIKGIGPKKGLALVKKHNNNFEKLFNEARWSDFFDFSWREVFDIIKNMPTDENYKILWNKINREKIFQLMVQKHGFSEERIENALSDLIEQKKQTGLSDFF